MNSPPLSCPIISISLPLLLLLPLLPSQFAAPCSLASPSSSSSKELLVDFVLCVVGVAAPSSCQEGMEALPGELRIGGFWGKDRLKWFTTVSVLYVSMWYKIKFYLEVNLLTFHRYTPSEYGQGVLIIKMHPPPPPAFLEELF